MIARIVWRFSVPLNATSAPIYYLQVNVIRIFFAICVKRGGKRKEIKQTTKAWLLVSQEWHE